MMLLWVLWLADAPEHVRVLASYLRGDLAPGEQEYTQELLEDLQADGLVRHVPDHPSLTRMEALLRNVRHARPLGLDYSPAPAFYAMTPIGCEYPPFLRFREEVLLLRQAWQETSPATRTWQVDVVNPLARVGCGPRELEVPLLVYLALTALLLLLALMSVVVGAEILMLLNA